MRMQEVDHVLMSKETRQKLSDLISVVSREQVILLDNITSEILSEIDLFAKISVFGLPVKRVEEIFLRQASNLSKDRQLTLKRAMVAKLACHLPVQVEKMNLPNSILKLYPDAVGRLADFLTNADDEPYDPTADFFRKDVRFVLGLTIPCGTFIVDLLSRFRLRTVLHSLLYFGDITAPIRYLVIKGYGPWLQMHIDQRYIAELNAEAHERMCLRIVELLKRRKDIVGVTATSWLYDPQLVDISPHHAYIRLQPLEGGAFFLQHRIGNNEILQATTTSKSRLRLYEEGKYIPREYSMLWPRKAMIAWAKQTQQGYISKI